MKQEPFLTGVDVPVGDKSGTSEALERLTSTAAELKAAVSKPIDLPEAPLTLNIEARAGYPKRVVRHIHQTCALHRGNYVHANRIKLAYLLDDYLSMAATRNPLGIYAMALERTPLSPFAAEELEQLTGSPIGMRVVHGMRTVGRNERCPCGSGTKYKACHGR